MTTIGIVVASTRPTRIGRSLADALESFAGTVTDTNYVMLDLKEIDLPFLNEPSHPALGRRDSEHAKAWSEAVNGVDSVLFLTPQYNGSFPAPLKNALDYLSAEWKEKPILIVSYGWRGGVAAENTLRDQLIFMGASVAHQSVVITMFPDDLDADNALVDPDAVIGRYTPQLTSALQLLSEGKPA